MKRILLINPPWHRNSEPPLGIGLIQAELARISRYSEFCVESSVLDLNALTAWKISESICEDGSRRTHRAIRHRRETLSALTSKTAYQSHEKYMKAMGFFADLMIAASHRKPWKVTPGDYIDERYQGFGPVTIAKIFSTAQDIQLSDITQDDLERTIHEKPHDMIGISITYRSQFIPGLIIAGRLLSICDKTKIILGGAFLASLSVKAIECLRKHGFQICLSDGESYFRDSLGVSRQENTSFLNPDFHGTESARYFAPGMVIPVVSSRGCYWSRCRFCDECRESYRMDAIENLSERLVDLSHQYPGALFHFCDHAIPPEVLDLLSEHHLGNHWYGFVRASSKLTNLQFVEQLAASGCKMLQIGFESPVQNVLQKMNKGVQAGWFPEIIHNCREVGIRTYAYMMFGFPGQTKADCNAAVEFLENNPPDYLNASIFRMPPGSPLSQLITDNSSGKARDDDSLYFKVESEGFPLSELRKWMTGTLQSSRLVRGIIKKTPRFYKSNHAVFIG